MSTEGTAVGRNGGASAEATVVMVGGLECAIVGQHVGSFPISQRVHPLVRYQEREYMVLDLPQFFATEQDADQDRLLVLFAQGEVRRGLVVDRVVGPIAFSTEKLLPVPEIYPQIERDCWRGLLPSSDGRLIAVPYLAGLTRAAFAGEQAQAAGGSYS